MADGVAPDLGALYRQTRERLTDLVAALAPAAWSTPVPACPGWTVHDVVGHLTAVTEDVLAGRLVRPPTDEETAAQVARFRGWDTPSVLARWTELAPAFEPVVGAGAVWPAVLDVGTHEQDVRSAVGLPGARRSDVVVLGAAQLLAWLRPPVPLRVVVEDDAFDVGTGAGPGLTVRSDRFEVFRWRLGRRSRRQLGALDWSADPAPVLDHLVIFGPALADVVE
ncbi:MAG TPA: maleylpyruvate isomerase family mycothiol-dependent enzyme [Acidimicrobiales bacterium]|nr:maleylpyruvate isomerase family mycothiol-dependent enzyme [Acidimicrobiales bacterium]